jgi:serine/threonine-protein kinase
MTPERYQQIGQLFRVALELEPSQRAAFLAEACAGDEALRREVESLLSSHEQATAFIAAPALAVAAQGLAEASAPSLIGERIGHYQILSQLGAGGMGEVYLAEDQRLRRKVALKLLPAQFTQDADRVRRFEQEARAASALNHPNIITIHEIGQVDGRHYIVTEFVDGQTLRQQMKSARLKLSEALEVAVQVASALTAAHEAGIVHRDIKPENLMLRTDGYVKVLDFGLAKLTEPAAQAIDTQAPTAAALSTETGMVMGTAHYMSPEQARGQKVDGRSDIFSLGIVLYEMVTGRAPFEGATSSDVIAALLGKEPLPLTQLLPEIPVELERIVTKALRKEREERYQTIKDLLVDLKGLRQELEARAKEPSVASGEVTAARQRSSAQYLTSKIHHHQRAALSVLAILVIAAVSLAYFFAGGKPIDSVAVLPFVNANADPNTEYLADGIPESIINSLSQLPHLKVMSRNSAFRFKGREINAQEVGQKLGVRAVLTGRVAQRGESLVINIELIDARDNRQIWGQQYNRKLADVFAVQEEMAKEISEQLRLKLSGAERQQLAKRPTKNLKAFQYYMQGRSYFHRHVREDLLEAIRYYEKALAEDRHYALAYAGLADTYNALGVRGLIAPIEGQHKTEEAARHALALDDNLAEAHASLGGVYIAFVPSNFSLGDRELRRAIELNPSLALAHQFLGLSLVRQGRLDEALEELLKARELDPLSPIIARGVAAPYYLKRDYARALELLRQANELGPPFSITAEIGVYIQNRLFDEALAELQKAKRERKGDPILVFSTGLVHAARGERAEALQVIKELEEMSGASLSQAQSIAKIHAALNEKELALAWLERGLAAGAIGLFIKDDPVWDPIRSDPRFRDLLRRMGIPT